LVRMRMHILLRFGRGIIESTTTEL